MERRIRNQNIVLPELSYEVVGALFDVFHELGDGYQEKYYYRAVRQSLEKRGLSVKAQVYIPVEFRESQIGNYYLDFLVNDKIILELKIGRRFRRIDFEQARGYLKATGKPLAILARIDKDGVTYHRVLPLISS